MASSYNHRKLLLSLNTTNIIPTVQTCLYFCNTTVENDAAVSVSHKGYCPPACLKICPSTCHYSLSTLFTSSHTNNPHDNHKLSPLLIFMLVLLASTFLLVTLYVVYTKLYSKFNNFNSSGSTQTMDSEHGPTTVFHPVWYIPTVGLSPTVIKLIKVRMYEVGMEACDCAVCLGEFIVGDELRILPKCNHTFHVSCVDTWLKSHVTCPLCRAPIDPSIDQGCDQTYEVSSSMVDESPREEVVVDVNNDEQCLEGEKGSSSQRWPFERGAVLVSRSLSCSGKIFSSQYNNRPSTNS